MPCWPARRARMRALSASALSMASIARMTGDPSAIAPFRASCASLWALPIRFSNTASVLLAENAANRVRSSPTCFRSLSVAAAALAGLGGPAAAASRGSTRAACSARFNCCILSASPLAAIISIAYFLCTSSRVSLRAPPRTLRLGTAALTRMFSTRSQPGAVAVVAPGAPLASIMRLAEK